MIFRRVIDNPIRLLLLATVVAILAFLCALVLGVAASTLRASARSTETCDTSTAPSRSYALSLCITSPGDNSTVSGNTPITVYVTIRGNHPDVGQFVYFLDDQSFEPDWAGDGSFTLATDQYPDGPHQLKIQAQMVDGFTSDPTLLTLVFNNGTAGLSAIAVATDTPTPLPAPMPTITFSTPSAAITPLAAVRSTATRSAKLASAPTTTLAPTVTPVATDTPADTSSSNTNSTSSTDSNSNACSGEVYGNVLTTGGTGALGATITITDGAGATQTTTTDSDGYYDIVGVADGNASVKMTPPGSVTAQTVSVSIVNCDSVSQDFTASTAATTPTATTTPTPTMTATVHGTGTATPTPSATANATGTGTLTATPTSTTNATGTATPTGTPAGTATNTPTNTPTGTPTVKPTKTATPTPTATGTPTRTRTPTPTPTATVTQGSFIFLPVADAYVSQASPSANYGAANTLRLDASPDLHAYLRWNVQGITGKIVKATLRVYATSASRIGYTARAVSSNTWTERGITYSNAPAVGNTIGASGALSANTWTTVDVTSLITGNGSFNLALVTTDTTQITLASREAGANAPQLVIITSP